MGSVRVVKAVYLTNRNFLETLTARVCKNKHTWTLLELSFVDFCGLLSLYKYRFGGCGRLAAHTPVQTKSNYPPHPTHTQLLENSPLSNFYMEQNYTACKAWGYHFLLWSASAISGIRAWRSAASCLITHSENWRCQVIRYGIYIKYRSSEVNMYLHAIKPLTARSEFKG